ncbi:MAG: D-alanyl-D-alanine carboxypeptidase family protein [Rhodospirillales bacterium]
MRRLILAVSVWLAGTAAALAAPPTIETPAKHAYMVDVATGTVLLDKDSAVAMPPASMSKLMTVFMVFERLKKGTLKMDDKLSVSEKAWRTGGSKMFVPIGGQVAVGDLLRGVIVQSGNDACVVLAEGLAGSEEAFAEAMTKRAREIGLKESVFKNADGLPADGHVMSARDIATLSLHLIREFPEFYELFAEKEFQFNGIKQGNRNPLLYQNMGADGLKTGHTEASGYGLAASVKRDGRRVILVVNGLNSMKQRWEETARLVNWAYREYDNVILFKKGETVEQADVWLGEQPKVPLVAARDVVMTVPRTAKAAIKAAVVYTGPVPAPIAKDAPVGEIRVEVPDYPPVSVPLNAGAEVGKLGPVQRIGSAVRYLLWGASG